MSKYTRASRTDRFDGAARRAHARVMQELRRAESVVTTPAQTIQPPKERRTQPKRGLWIARPVPSEWLPERGTFSALETPPYLDVISELDSVHLSELLKSGVLTEDNLFKQIGKVGLDTPLDDIEIERVFTEPRSDRFSTVFALPSSNVIGEARRMHADLMSRVDVTYPHRRPPVRINFGTYPTDVATNLIGTVHALVHDGVPLGGATISYQR